MKNSTSGAIPFAAPQLHQSLASTPDLQMDQPVAERRRHAVDDGAVGIPVAAGDQRCALGQRVLAALPFEEELIQSRLDHRHGGRQLFQVDEPQAGVVPTAAGTPAAPSGCGRRCRATGCRAGRRGRARAHGRRHSCGWRRPRPVRAIIDLAAPGGSQTMVGCRASTRRASTSASSLGRSV